MSLLKQVVKGKLKNPHLLLLYGTDGVGKSTFGASAPNPIFLGTEDGTASLDVARFPAPESFAQVIESIEVLSKEPHDYKTLVVDSLDWLEPLVWEKVCKDGEKKKIEDFGYGKGFSNALHEWRKMMNALKSLRFSKGMDIVLIAHSQVKTFNDPSLVEGYDRYQMKLNDKASALLGFPTLAASEKLSQLKGSSKGNPSLFLASKAGRLWV